MLVDEGTKAEYLAAWEDWRRQVEHLHRVFFEDEPIRPEQLKGLLNREARRKDLYDAARLRLLGLEGVETEAADPDVNPFKSAG